MHLLENLPLSRALLLASTFLLFVSAMLGRALVEELGVCLHEQLQHIECQAMHRAIPVLLRVLVKGTDNDREQLLPVRVDQLHDVICVPKEKRPLGYLEVGACNAQREAPEEDVLHAVELWRLGQFERLLQLIEEQHLLRGDRHGPVAQHRGYDVIRQARVLLNILRHAVGQLLVEGSQGFHLVQWDESFDQEVFVLFLQRQCEAVDNAAQDFKQLTDSVVSLRFVDDLEEDVLNSTSDEGSQGHEFAVDAVQDRLQVIPLPWILGIEQLQELQHEILIDEALGDFGIHVIGDNEPQEKLVHDLQMWPGALQTWFIVFWVGECQWVLVARLQGSEDVSSNHADDILHQCLVEAISGIVHVLDDLQERLALGFLLLLVVVVVEVKNDGADLHLLAEKVGALLGRRLAEFRDGCKVGRLRRRFRCGRPTSVRICRCSLALGSRIRTTSAAVAAATAGGPSPGG
mmetsp:Transcript_51294/g.120285  ORF Transcript_51294/g.120285 Transcript_51294/m.120285 type:complete len:461 (+) Transcript_51294:85-1467(+)